MFTDVKKGYKVIVFFSVQFNTKSSIVSIEIYFSSIEKYLQRIIPWNLTKMKDIGFANICTWSTWTSERTGHCFFSAFEKDSTHNLSQATEKRAQRKTKWLPYTLLVNQCSFRALLVQCHVMPHSSLPVSATHL